MPLMVNYHGVITCVNDDGVDDALCRGLRLVDESDITHLQTHDYFRVPQVSGFEQGQLGMRIVQVRGKGPSWQPALPDAFVIDINGKRDDDADAVLCLDDEAWDIVDTENVVRFGPKGHQSMKVSNAFTMPMQPVNGLEESFMRVGEGDAIRHAHFSGIAGVLVALYLTKGPVVISGFDLKGKDAGGVSYADRQAGAWRAAFKLWDRVFVDTKHPRKFGPEFIRKTESGEAAILGGGPSGKRPMLHKAQWVATCNEGIHRIANPDYYWLTDPHAQTQYTLHAQQRAELFGAQICDNSTHPYSGKPETYHGRSSGVLVLRAVLEDFKPKRVTLWGFDGYNEDLVDELPDGTRLWRTGMNSAMASALRRIFDEHKDVEFVWPCEGPLKRMVEAA